MNYYDYHYQDDNKEENINNQDNMIDKDNMNVTVIDYDNGYDGIFTSVLLLSFMTGGFIYIGKKTDQPLERIRPKFDKKIKFLD